MVVILVVIAALGVGMFGMRANERQTQQAETPKVAVPDKAPVAVKPG